MDRQVEHRIHRRKDNAQGDDDPAVRGVERAKITPGTAPDSEYQRRARDPEPRHAERFDPREQQNCERGTKIVEDRAGDEIKMRWNAIGAERARGSERWPRQSRRGAVHRAILTAAAGHGYRKRNNSGRSSLHNEGKREQSLSTLGTARRSAKRPASRPAAGRSARQRIGARPTHRNVRPGGEGARDAS